MKKFLIQSVLLVVVIGFGIFMFNSQATTLPFLPQTAVYKQVVINNGKLKVEVVNTQAKRGKGLSDRQSLGQDEGMLFVFEKVDKYPFWMKGLKFPLDFIWIRDNKVVDILENVPPPSPGQKDESLPIYLPKEPVDKVLEVNTGTVARLNIKVGDEVRIQ